MYFNKGKQTLMKFFAVLLKIGHHREKYTATVFYNIHTFTDKWIHTEKYGKMP